MTVDTTAATPAQLAELERNLADPMWRLSNLYFIIVKGDEDDEGLVMRFEPNVAQRKLLRRLWHRNLVLKVRQRGITTLIALLWLDTALFSKGPVKCGIVAHEREAAEEIFRDKVLFAYNRLPEVLRDRFPLKKKTETQIVFKHNDAVVKVATSMRGGTTHRLHVSEFGKIAAKYPARAREVMTGSIPSVPKTGIIVIESTAEGQDGEFYELTRIAMSKDQTRLPLTLKDYRFHFFNWWDAPEYELDAEGFRCSEGMLEYFRKVESIIGRALSDRKRAWYVATLENDFAGDQPMMWQEYPSYPDEAFAVSTEGCYYATQLTKAREQGRVRPSLPVEAVPVNTFWDLGRNDMMAIWLHQRVGAENRFIGYYENSGEELVHYVGWLMEQATKRSLVFGRHFLPHDAAIKRLGETPDTNRSPLEMLEALMPGHRFEVVPRVTSVISGITATRNVFASCYFDETACECQVGELKVSGVKRLANYRKEWDKERSCWKDHPRHDDNSHGADAFRQFGQVADAGEKFAGGFVAAGAVAGTAATGRRRWGAARRGGGGSPMAV
ncbi:MAG: terminase [Burkholderiales bacterium]|nr:terminase [Burkholderiales bacterium]